MPAFLALYLFPRSARVTDAADVERTHGELRAGLADRLGGDDADGHAFFDQRAGGEIHAVAEAADAQRRIAGEAAADVDLFQAQLLDLAATVGVMSSFSLTMISSVMGLTMFCRLTRPRIESAETDFDFFAAIDHALGDALGGAAIVRA